MSVPLVRPARGTSGCRAGREGPCTPGTNLAAVGELQASGKHRFHRHPREIGVGAGILLGRRLFRGMRGFSVELGHVTTRLDGAHCAGRHPRLLGHLAPDAEIATACSRRLLRKGRRALPYEQWPPHCLHRTLDAPVARGVRGHVGVKDV
jgi:hypothetical protein